MAPTIKASCGARLYDRMIVAVGPFGSQPICSSDPGESSMVDLARNESLPTGRAKAKEASKYFAKRHSRERQKWGSLLQSDPFYSPHLTLDREDFSIRA
jgi:hypothetical protein